MRPLWSAGFRPFFLVAALHGAAVIGLWTGTLEGLGLPAPARYFGPSVWHAHELIQGFTVAVVAGFLLTAVQRWTGVAMPRGKGLAALVSLWAVGRAASAFAGTLPGELVAALDLSFLPVLAAVVGRAVWRAGSRRNYFIPALLAALWACSAAVHLDALGVLDHIARPALAAAVDLLLTLTIVITGRIVPMFTRNATDRTGIESRPTLDRLAIGATVTCGLASLVGAPPALLGMFAALAAVAIIARAWRWGAQHTAGNPLLWVLHVGHGWAAIAMGLRALSHWTGWIDPLTALHAATAGTISMLCVGMMARVSLGHTGRDLSSPRLASASFALLALAAALRVFSPSVLPPSSWHVGMAAAGLAWCTALVLYLIAYASILIGPTPEARRAGIPLPLVTNT
jgi:uncharacterized protein involved in response to NO